MKEREDCQRCKKNWVRWTLTLEYEPISREGDRRKNQIRLCSECVGQLEFVPRGVENFFTVLSRDGDDLLGKDGFGSSEIPAEGKPIGHKDELR